MKEVREGGASSCIEDWDLGGRAEYLLSTDLVLHILTTFLCSSNSLTKIIFHFFLSALEFFIYYISFPFTV